MVKLPNLGYIVRFVPYCFSNTVTNLFPYTGSVQSVTLVPGTYNIQMWGADGGDSSNGTGGKGGYSFGTLVISSSTTLLYLCGW